MDGALILDRLSIGMPGVSPARGSQHAEASMVCFYLQNHESGVQLKIQGYFDDTLAVVWDGVITEQIKNSWLDQTEATESAACGMAFLIMQELTEYTVVRRAKKLDGFDYFLGFKENRGSLFKEAAKLEISGILNAKNAGEVRTRVNEKIEQSRRTRNDLPAYVVIVEFGKPLSHVERY